VKDVSIAEKYLHHTVPSLVLIYIQCQFFTNKLYSTTTVSTAVVICIVDNYFNLSFQLPVRLVFSNILDVLVENPAAIWKKYRKQAVIGMLSIV
jgi:Sec-independent protein secretion pathway component TatC